MGHIQIVLCLWRPLVQSLNVIYHFHMFSRFGQCCRLLFDNLVSVIMKPTKLNEINFPGSFRVNMNQVQKSFTQLNYSTTSPLLNISNATHAPYTNFQSFWLNLGNNILVLFYSGIVFLMITLTIGRSLVFYRFCNKASIKLHNHMFYKIVYATMRFFNTNPSGRILNRFSKDMNQVDEMLPMILLDTLQV